MPYWNVEGEGGSNHVVNGAVGTTVNEVGKCIGVNSTDVNALLLVVGMIAALLCLAASFILWTGWLLKREIERREQTRKELLRLAKQGSLAIEEDR